MSTAIWHCSTFITWTGWTLSMTKSWWLHHKDCRCIIIVIIIIFMALNHNNVCIGFIHNLYNNFLAYEWCLVVCTIWYMLWSQVFEHLRDNCFFSHRHLLMCYLCTGCVVERSRWWMRYLAVTCKVKVLTLAFVIMLCMILCDSTCVPFSFIIVFASDSTLLGLVKFVMRRQFILWWIVVVYV